MAKRKYKKKQRDYSDNSVYIFHNQLFNFDMFINATNANEAMERFDQCCMGNRSQWKILVEIGHQPNG